MAPSSKAEEDEGRSGDVLVDAMEDATTTTSAEATTTTRPPPPPPPSASTPASSSAAPVVVDEVDRILRVQHNAYAVLKLDRRARPTAEDIKKAHRALSRLVHPDKNPGNPRAADASAAVNAAVDVLSDPVKRRIFDLYVQDAIESNGGEGGGEGGEAGKSFADWEAEAMRPPRWLLRALACPGGGVVVAVLALLLLVPALALLLVVALLCLPLRLVLWHCCGVGEPVFVRKRKGRKGRKGGEREEGQEKEGGGGSGGVDVELGETRR